MIIVDCPYSKNSDDIYTTDECGVCDYFWDCRIGLEACLDDDSFSNYHEEIINILHNW